MRLTLYSRRMSQVPGQETPPYSSGQEPYGAPGQQPYGAPGQQPYGGQGQPYRQGPLSPADLPWRSGTDDNTFAIIAHVGAIVVSFIAPLIILLTKGKESGYVRNQSVEALNWSITIAIGYVISGILTLIFIGILTYLVLGIAAVVFGIIAAIAASKGETYKYPWALRLVK